MSAIERVRAHYDEHGIRELHVPEWDLTVFAKPMTIRQHDNLSKKSGNSTFIRMVYALIDGALDEKGDNLFTLQDKQSLMVHADSEVVMRVGIWLLDPTREAEEEAKND